MSSKDRASEQYCFHSCLPLVATVAWTAEAESQELHLGLPMVQGTRYFSHHLLLPGLSIIRRLGLGAEMELDQRYSKMECRVPRQCLHSYARGLPSVT